MAGINIRKEMPGVELDKDEFRKRYCERFSDPVFGDLRDKEPEAMWRMTR